MQNKLQHAGWQADVVDHQSDAESDDAASDVEKDLSFSEETLAQLMQ